MAKKPKYLVLHPHLLGLRSEKRRKYFFHYNGTGYILNISKGVYIGFPKIIIENNPELYKKIEDEKSKT